MAREEGFIPQPLSADKLKKLVQEALEKAPDDHNPETFHALFDHLERGLTTDDVIHALEGTGRLPDMPSTKKNGSTNMKSMESPSMGLISLSLLQ
jgi:hypothetical protein